MGFHGINHGAAAMAGKNKGLKSKVLEVAPHIDPHLILSLTVFWIIQSKLHINHIKSHPAISRLSGQVTTYRKLMVITGSAPSQLYELHEKVHSLLKDSKLGFAHHLSHPDWLSKPVVHVCMYIWKAEHVESDITRAKHKHSDNEWQSWCINKKAGKMGWAGEQGTVEMFLELL